MSEERYVPWEQVTNGCVSLVIDNILAFEDIEVVVGMSNDMVPATIISNLLKVPVIPVIRQEVLEVEIDNLIDIYKPIQSGQGELPPNPKLLVVSSMIGTGSKVKEIVETYRQRGHDVTVIALFHCSDCGYVPDIYWHRATECKSKLIFPWEL